MIGKDCVLLVMGNLTILNDFSVSVHRALQEIDPNYLSYDGLVVCGTHAPHDTEMMIEKIREARETGRVFYGECFGHQLACIEWARSVMGIPDATSEEFGKGTFVVVKRPKLKVGYVDGESWWSNYMVREDVEKNYIENKPKTFFLAPFHPSYQSRIGNFHPLLVKFLKACQKQVV